MATSLAGLVVTALNQMILQVAGFYPRWIFWMLGLPPFLFMPRLHRRLDQQYGFTRNPGTA